MSAVKTYTEVRSLVKKEIDAIKKRDGELPPTAYIVTEIAVRLKTLTPWDTYDKAYPLARNLRKVVDDIIQGKPNLEALAKKESREEILALLPISKDEYDELQDNLGDKKKTSKSVDLLPSTVAKRQKLKRKLRKAG
jgi:hypothetical protein